MTLLVYIYFWPMTCTHFTSSWAAPTFHFIYTFYNNKSVFLVINIMITITGCVGIRHLFLPTSPLAHQLSDLIINPLSQTLNKHWGWCWCRAAPMTTTTTKHHETHSRTLWMAWAVDDYLTQPNSTEHWVRVIKMTCFNVQWPDFVKGVCSTFKLVGCALKEPAWDVTMIGQWSSVVWSFRNHLIHSTGRRL